MKRLHWWLLLAGYSTAIFYFSSLEAPPAPSPIFPYQDKVLHYVEYVPFGWLILKAFSPATPKGFVSSAFFALIYAASDEAHQGMVIGREPDLLDWLADAAGILTPFARRLL